MELGKNRRGKIKYFIYLPLDWNSFLLFFLFLKRRHSRWSEYLLRRVYLYSNLQLLYLHLQPPTFNLLANRAECEQNLCKYTFKATEVSMLQETCKSVHQCKRAGARNFTFGVFYKHNNDYMVGWLPGVWFFGKWLSDWIAYTVNEGLADWLPLTLTVWILVWANA
jgi:hypothetical protein